MYVSYSYYVKNYGGSQIASKEEFQRAAREAESYIRYLTCVNGDIFADAVQTDVIKNAVCAAADACQDARMEQKSGGNLKSESKDGFSVSFIVSRKDGENVDGYVKRCMYQAVKPVLLPTGWLSRRGKAGCTHGHKCESCDCL